LLRCVGFIKKQKGQKVMFHGAIIGATGSGKTFGARHLAKEYIKRGCDVLVLHKEDEAWHKGEQTIQTAFPELFLEQIAIRNALNDTYATQGLNHLIKGFVGFMEMADADANKYDDRFHKLFRKGRHKGHKFFFLSQRAQIVHPDIRENCSELFLYSCYHKAAKLWAEELNDDILLKASRLPPWYFYHKKNRFDPAVLKILKP
jgi:hypothetical protein